MLVAKTVIWPCLPPSNAVLLAPAQTNSLTTFCRTGASANTSSVGHQTVRQANAPQPPDFGILKWSTSAVCFGPPWAQQTSTLDLSVSLDLEAGVGLESPS